MKNLVNLNSVNELLKSLGTNVEITNKSFFVVGPKGIVDDNDPGHVVTEMETFKLNKNFNISDFFKKNSNKNIVLLLNEDSIYWDGNTIRAFIGYKG